jgi:hypothetical protein
MQYIMQINRAKYVENTQNQVDTTPEEMEATYPTNLNQTHG